MSDFYVLKDNEPVPANIHDWIAWLELHEQRRHIACTSFEEGPWVSTVFTGVNLAMVFDKGAAPRIFETMVFWTGHKLDRRQCRTATWQEATEEHERCCALVRAALREQEKVHA